MNNYKNQYYNVESNSICYFIIYLITVIMYFVFFNYYTDGQTLGKKVFRLKIVNNDEKSKVSILNYLIRAIFLYQPIYYIIKLIGIFTLNKGNYYNITSIIYDIQYYLEFIIILTVIIKTDGRGLHDIISKTRVASYDRNNQEIDKESVSFITKKLDEKVSEKKEQIKKSKKLKN